jgi:hypothetical protein
MRVTLLDTETGETRLVGGISTFDWAENNWSCDCNRSRLFNADGDEDHCVGSHRFIVVHAVVELVDSDYPATLRELNADYPPELLDKYLYDDDLRKQQRAELLELVKGLPTVELKMETTIQLLQGDLSVEELTPDRLDVLQKELESMRPVSDEVLRKLDELNQKPLPS